MPFTNDPQNSLADQVRLLVGDTDPQFPFLSDESYEYVLQKNNNNVNRSAIDAAQMILFSIARFTRERTAEIEVYGSDFFKAYRDALLIFLNNPNASSVINSAMPYAGGISNSDSAANNANPDNRVVPIVNRQLPSGIDYRQEEEPYYNRNSFSGSSDPFSI